MSPEVLRVAQLRSNGKAGDVRNHENDEGISVGSAPGTTPFEVATARQKTAAATLLATYEQNPGEVAAMLRKELGITGNWN